MKKCAFCLRTGKLSGEHIWSDWICELFPPLEIKVKKWSAGEKEVKEWESISLDHKASVVCKSCNEGWMSDLEGNHAKPAMKEAILSDAPITLSTEKLVAISMFAFKTIVVADHMERNKLPFFSSLSRVRFRNTLHPPIGFQVWIGCISEFDRHYGFFRWHYMDSPPRVNPGYRLLSVTWGVGRFFFQATAIKFNKRKFRGNLFPHLTQSRDWNSFAIPIWPMLRGEITAKWPPVSHIANYELEQFTYRWRSTLLGSFW
jgi:hypothetical protein